MLWCQAVTDALKIPAKRTYHYHIARSEVGLFYFWANICCINCDS